MELDPALPRAVLCAARAPVLATFSVTSVPFRVFILKTYGFFRDFRRGTALAKRPATTSGIRVEVGARGITEEKCRNDEPAHTEVFNFRCGNPGACFARRSVGPVGTLSPGSLSG